METLRTILNTILFTSIMGVVVTAGILVNVHTIKEILITGLTMVEEEEEDEEERGKTSSNN